MHQIGIGSTLTMSRTFGRFNSIRNDWQIDKKGSNCREFNGTNDRLDAIMPPVPEIN